MKHISTLLLSVISFLTLLPSLALSQTPVAASYNAPEATFSSDTTPSRFTPNLVIAAELSKSLDARKNKVGDKVEAISTMDLLFHGQIVLPRDTKILGHVTNI